MAFAGNASIMGDFPKFIAHHKLFRGNALHANTTYLIPPFFGGLGSDGEFNASYYHELLLNANNDSYGHCASIQMPVGSLISMFLYAIVCIVGLFGNTLVIYVVLRFSKMQTVTNMYILNLAIADECFLIGIPFLIMTMYSGEWTFGKGMCKAYMVSTSITQFTSSIFLFIMSADRYVAVCHPVASPRYRSPFVSKVVSAIAWTASAIIMLPVMMYATTIEKENKKLTCNIEWPQDNEAGSGTTFTLYSLILGFAIPLTFILMFYYMVLRKLQTVGPINKSKEKKRTHRKVTKLVLTVIAVYILCWLPYWISQVALITSPPHICNTRLEITLFVLVGCLGYSNSAMNPILYAFLSDNFKKSFLKACHCAAGKDLNTQLQLENSLFPRFGKRSSEKYCSTTKTGGGVTTNQPNTMTTSNATNANNTNNTNNLNQPTQLASTIDFNSIAINDDGKQLASDALLEVKNAEAQQLEVNSQKSQIFLSSSSGKSDNLSCSSNERPPVLHTDL